jgi:ribonuclease Z
MSVADAIDTSARRGAGATRRRGISGKGCGAQPWRPCLAFAFEEKLRVNVWREGLRRLGLPVGPWLRDAKRAVRQGAPDHTQLCVHDGLAISLGDLKQHALRTRRGVQRVGVA